MIEILAVKEARYKTVEEIPIEINMVIRNKKYCELVHKAYIETREELHNRCKNPSEDWEKIAIIFDRNFMNALLCIWKEKVFEKSKNFSKEELGAEKEKQLIEDVLYEGSVQEKVKEFFLENLYQQF